MIQRYIHSENVARCMNPHPVGGWVQYADHAEEIAQLTAEVDRLGKERDEVLDTLDSALEWASALERYDSNKDDLPSWVPTAAVIVTYAEKARDAHQEEL